MDDIERDLIRETYSPETNENQQFLVETGFLGCLFYFVPALITKNLLKLVVNIGRWQVLILDERSPTGELDNIINLLLE